MTALSDFINTLSVDETAPEYVVKYIRARDLVAHLPAPANLKRDLRLVPDINVKLLLSENGKQPEFIRKKIANSKQRGIFQPDTLMGLCFSGLGASPEMFLNAGLMKQMDPTGNLFDEITWHEYMHGGEGITGPSEREIPWSYGLQQAMLNMDKEKGHISWTEKSLSKKFNSRNKYVQYLREGTELQDNVSEIFARVGVLFFNHITNTGHGLTPEDVGFFDPRGFDMDWSINNRVQYNLTDFWTAVSTYSDLAQNAFLEALPEAISRVATLYGCRPA